MLLDNKVAAVYGGGGKIGGAGERAFAREGAHVFLAGRTSRTLDHVADNIRSAGGTASTAAVDALDERAVDDFVDTVDGDAGSATLADVGNVAAWVASDQARSITAADVNISCGSIMD